jgi:carotenoid 1,2-hydratase
MTERPKRKLSRDKTHLTIGPSRLEWCDDHLVIAVDEISVPLPRRVRGTIRLYPSAPTHAAFALDDQGVHHWWPISPMGRIVIEMTDPDLSWSGHAYFDSNAGSQPLESSFCDWDWSRSTNGSGVQILYDVRGGNLSADKSLALYVKPNGVLEQRPAPNRQSMTSGIWGVARSTLADDESQAKVTRALEDTPFYTRSTITSTIGGQAVQSMHESLSLARFNTRWVQTLLPFRMPRF